jgi:hypothetical protein
MATVGCFDTLASKHRIRRAIVALGLTGFDVLNKKGKSKHGRFLDYRIKIIRKHLQTIGNVAVLEWG